jgi:ankyrin repeat protein
VRAELARGVSATCTDEGGCHPLAWAAHYGQFAIVDLLLAHGADVNQPNRKTSKTTLQELALWGRGSGDASVAAEHMKQLLARGADPDLLTSDGLTALMIAARTGTTGPNLSLLLKITKDVNARSKAGQTALGLAREYGHAEVARELIAHGAVE